MSSLSTSSTFWTYLKLFKAKVSFCNVIDVVNSVVVVVIDVIHVSRVGCRVVGGYVAAVVVIGGVGERSPRFGFKYF